MGASAGTSRLPERLRSGSSLKRRQHRVVAAGCLEFQRLDQVGRELTQCHVAIGGAQQRVFIGEIGELASLRPNTKQLRPADGLVNNVEGVAFARPAPSSSAAIVPWNKRISRPTSLVLAT